MHTKKFVQEMLDHLTSHAANRAGCADDQCPLDRHRLRRVLTSLHGDTLGTCLFTLTFDNDHDPRKRDRKDVNKIYNDILRAREATLQNPGVPPPVIHSGPGLSFSGNLISTEMETSTNRHASK